MEIISSRAFFFLYPPFFDIINCAKDLTNQEILKSTDNNYMPRVIPIAATISFVFGIIFTSIYGGRGAPLPPPEELQTTSTVPLENLSLAPGDFIILADSTPVPIESAHVSMNVPCQVATAAA